MTTERKHFCQLHQVEFIQPANPDDQWWHPLAGNKFCLEEPVEEPVRNATPTVSKVKSHFCKKHLVPFTKMPNWTRFQHLISGTDLWCVEQEDGTGKIEELELPPIEKVSAPVIAKPVTTIEQLQAEIEALKLGKLPNRKVPTLQEQLLAFRGVAELLLSGISPKHELSQKAYQFAIKSIKENTDAFQPVLEVCFTLVAKGKASDELKAVVLEWLKENQ